MRSDRRNAHARTDPCGWFHLHRANTTLHQLAGLSHTYKLVCLFTCPRTCMSPRIRSMAGTQRVYSHSPTRKPHITKRGCSERTKPFDIFFQNVKIFNKTRRKWRKKDQDLTAILWNLLFFPEILEIQLQDSCYMCRSLGATVCACTCMFYAHVRQRERRGGFEWSMGISAAWGSQRERGRWGE